MGWHSSWGSWSELARPVPPSPLHAVPPGVRVGNHVPGPLPGQLPDHPQSGAHQTPEEQEQGEDAVSTGLCPPEPRTLRLRGLRWHPHCRFLLSSASGHWHSDLRGRWSPREQGQGPSPLLDKRNVTQPVGAVSATLPIYDYLIPRPPASLESRPPLLLAGLSSWERQSLREPLCPQSWHLKPSGWGVDMPPEVGCVTCYLRSPRWGREEGPGSPVGTPSPDTRFCCWLPPSPNLRFSVERVFTFSENCCCALCSLCFMSPLIAGHLGKVAGPASDLGFLAPGTAGPKAGRVSESPPEGAPASAPFGWFEGVT